MKALFSSLKDHMSMSITNRETPSKIHLRGDFLRILLLRQHWRVAIFQISSTSLMINLPNINSALTFNEPL